MPINKYDYRDKTVLSEKDKLHIYERKILNIHILNTFFFSLVVATVIGFYFNKIEYAVTLLSFPLIFGVLGWLNLNKGRYYIKYAFSTLGTFYIFFLSSSFGFNSSFHYLFMLSLFIIIVDFFPFNSNHKTNWFFIAYSIGCVLIALLALNATNFSLLLRSDITPKDQALLTQFNLFLVFFGFTITGLILGHYNHKRTQALKLKSQQLKRNEGLLETINANLQAAVYRSNPEGRLEYFNQAFADMFGYTNNALTDKEFRVNNLYYNPKERKILLSELEQNDVLKNKEFLLRNAEGKQFWGLMNISKVIDDDGLMKYDGSIIDITETKELAVKNQETKAFYEKIINKIPIDVVIFNKDHKYQLVNEHGLPNPELRDWIQGKDVFDYFKFRKKPIAVAQIRRNKFNEAVKSGKNVSWQEELINRQGKMEYHIRSFEPLLKENGEVEWVIGHGINVTKLRNIQLDLEKRNLELTKLNEELDSFVYSVSHDLRAPLTSALGLIELCNYENDINQIRTYLDLQNISLKKLDSFIRDILDYSKNSRLELSAKSVDFHDFIKNIFNQYQFNNDAAHLNQKVIVQGNGTFLTDTFRLSIILNNLISNAIRYSDKTKDKPFIRIEVDYNSDKAIIKVIDNGIGIEDDYLSKIFSMFYRAHSQSKGSGLGLYILKETLNKLKGSIQVDSKIGKGTTFTLEIPNMSKNKISKKQMEDAIPKD